MVIRPKFSVLMDLVDCGIVSSEDAVVLLEHEDLPYIDTELVSANSCSRVGQTWQAATPFSFHVLNDTALPLAPGLATWGISGELQHVESGDLLLVLADRVGSLSQLLVNLADGRQYWSYGWTRFCTEVA